jgi:hypothetical protein
MGGAPLLEIKEGRKLYLRGELKCIRNAWREIIPGTTSTTKRIYFAMMNLEEYKLYKLEKNTGPRRPCPLEGIVFGSAGVGYYSMNETANYEIVVDEFDGEWGKIYNVFDDGSPLYVRIAKEERHHFHVNISRHQAGELARAHFPRFDETTKNFSACLKDEKSVCNADLRQAFLADESEYYRYENMARHRRPDLSKLPQISEETRKLAQERMEIARSELIKFLDNGAKDFHEYYESGFGVCGGDVYGTFHPRRTSENLCYYYGFYLKDIDTVIGFAISDDVFTILFQYSGTFIDVTYSAHNEELDGQGPYSKRIRHVLPHSRVHYTNHYTPVYPRIIFLRFHAHGSENPYFSVKPRESLKEMGIILEPEVSDVGQSKKKNKEK